MNAEKPPTDLRQQQMTALASGDYASLAVHRLQQSCYLIINAHGAAHVLVNDQGRAQTFRHVWQIKDWLQQAFGIAADKVSVNNLKSERKIFD
jgi:hypothetical protein